MDLLTDNDRWVTRLARALILDGDEAEDVVQEARITLWTHPPDQTETARAWLHSVIRNLIRNRSRNRQRRALRLQRLGEPAAEASPHELMERFETHHRLAALVSALEEPFRQTMVLRFYEGISAAEIARRTKTPPGTVRWRIKEGLDRLRASLDSEPGGRAAWVVGMTRFLDRDRFPITPAAALRGPLPWVWTRWLAMMALGVVGGVIIPAFANPEPTDPANAFAFEIPEWARVQALPPRAIRGSTIRGATTRLQRKHPPTSS